MSSSDVLVALSALGAIVWVNWYFFLSHGQTAVATAVAGGVQEVTVQVRGGYAPATLQARTGSRVRITFDRQENSSCSEEVVFADFGVRRFLPAFKKTTIEVEPQQAGSYAFTCGMGMLQGRLVVTDADGAA